MSQLQDITDSTKEAIFSKTSNFHREVQALILNWPDGLATLVETVLIAADYNKLQFEKEQAENQLRTNKNKEDRATKRQQEARLDSALEAITKLGEIIIQLSVDDRELIESRTLAKPND